MDTSFVFNSFPKNNIFVTGSLKTVKNNLYTILLVAMVTKFNNLSCFYEFVAMKTTDVLNYFPKNNIVITAFILSIKNGFYTIFVVAMVTKFKNLS